MCLLSAIKCFSVKLTHATSLHSHLAALSMHGAGSVVLSCSRGQRTRDAWQTALGMTTKYMELEASPCMPVSPGKQQPRVSNRDIAFPALLLNLKGPVMIPVGESREEMWPEGLLQERFCFPLVTFIEQQHLP